MEGIVRQYDIVPDIDPDSRSGRAGMAVFRWMTLFIPPSKEQVTATVVVAALL